MESNYTYLDTHKSRSMWEYLPNEFHEDKIKYDKSIISSTFTTTSLAYTPDRIKCVPDFLANLTGNEKQKLVLALDSSAEFEAFSLGMVSVNVCSVTRMYSAGMTFYLHPYDTITKLKEEIRKIMKYKNEEKLRIMFYGRLLKPLMVRHGNDPQEYPSKETADSEDTLESIGMNGKCWVTLAPIM